MAKRNKKVLYRQDIMTSSLYMTEVLVKGDEERKKLGAFTKRRNFQPIQVSDSVVERSKKLREHYVWMKTPDAIHLATAIIYKASEFHTFDGSTVQAGSSKPRL